MTLIGLVILVLGFNLITFGNGPVMIPLLQRELVDARGVLTVDQLLYAFAIARATPGQANMYVASIGYFLFGLPGAVATILAIILPGYAMLPLLRIYDRFHGQRDVAAFIDGLTAASVGLILAATVGLAPESLTEPISWLVFATAVVLLVTGRVPGIVAVAAAALGGLVFRTVLG